MQTLKVLQLGRTCIQPQLIKHGHNVTFSRCFLHRKTGTALEARALGIGVGLHLHTNNVMKRAVAANLSILTRYIRAAPPCSNIIRLMSTTNTDDPVRGVGTVTQPSNQSVLPSLDLVKLRSWAFSVEPFGSLSVHTSSSVRVTPIDPHDYPAADRAFVHLLLGARRGNDKTKKIFNGLVNDDRLNWGQLMKCDVQYKDDVIHVRGDALVSKEDRLVSKEDIEFVWLVEIPISYDVHAVTTNEGSVSIEQLENQTCKVHTEEGDIVTKKLKSDTVTLQSARGDVSCLKLLQGNITIATGNHGTIMTDRLQGKDVCIHSDSGSIAVKDIYARKSELESVGGDIHLGNLYGDVDVACHEGNLTIGSIDGSLSATIEKGNMSAYLANHGDVNITCKQGDICLKMSPDIKTGLDLRASTGIDVPEELAARFSPKTAEENCEPGAKTKIGDLNGAEDSSLTARADRGNITLMVQSWFDSLQLQK